METDREAFGKATGRSKKIEVQKSNTDSKVRRAGANQAKAVRAKVKDCERNRRGAIKVDMTKASGWQVCA